jgi:single-strand DNA-binding protein
MLRLTSIVRLGQDATVNYVNGKNVINFTAAYSEKYKNQEGVEVNNVVWISCAYWTEKINLANYLRKGVQILIEGKPEAKIYTNKQGQSIPQLNVRVSNIQLLGSSNNQNNQQPQNESANNNSEELMISGDDLELPF